MTTPFIIASHNNGDGARELAAALGCRLVAHSATGPIPRNKTVINLGCNPAHPAIQRAEQLQGYRIFNGPLQVGTAQSKLATFERLALTEYTGPLHASLGGTVTVPFLTDPRIVALRVRENNETWVARTLDRASSGAGIELVTQDVLSTGRIPRAGVYTKAIEKRREYRVHVIRLPHGGYVVADVVRKIRRPGVDDTNRPFIWNHDADFIFVRNGVNRDTVPNRVLQKALIAVRGMSLHFGAVDVIVERGGRLADAQAYVLEINTAPGMEGQTVQMYAQYFRSLIGEAEAPVWVEDFTEEQGE